MSFATVACQNRHVLDAIFSNQVYDRLPAIELEFRKKKDQTD